MQKIRIDFDNPGLPQHISAVENDSQSRFFEAALYENGKAYTAPEGATYSIMYRGFGPQNQGWYDTINDGAGKRAACAVSGNVVTCEIARQALQVPGHVSIVLCVTTGKGYMLKSWPIECDCKNDRYDSTVEIQSFFYVTQVSNADWNRILQALEDLKNTIDPTLSVSGKAADAAKVGQLKEDVIHNKKFLYNSISLSFDSLYNHWVSFPIYAGHSYKFAVYGAEGKCIIRTADAHESTTYIETLVQEISVGETTIVKSSNDAEYLVVYTDTASAIKINVDDISTLINWENYKYVNVLEYGADKFGTSLSNDAFIRAIADANKLHFGIYIPSGKYIITKELPNIWCGCHIKGEGGVLSRVVGTSIEDRRTSFGKYLINFVTIDNKYANIGGGITDITFLHYGNGHTGCINISKPLSGWTSIYSNLKIDGYLGPAISMRYANDARFTNCIITNCGGFYDTYQEFAIRLANNTNAIHFIGCHIEHCRYDIYSTDSCFNIIFNSCKIEQSAKNAVSNNVPCVNFNCDTNDTIAQFQNCTFINIDMDNYLNSDDVNYNNVPYMFGMFNAKNGAAIFNGCSFTCGYGSGDETVSKEIGQARFISGKVISLTASSFTYVAWCDNAIKLIGANSSIVANNIFIVNDKGNRLNASGKAIISSGGENIIKDNLLIKTVDCAAVISEVS